MVFVNAKSGAAASEDDPAALIRAGLPGVEVRACPPDELDAAVDEQVEAGAEWVGIAGGDGTIRSAASRLVGRQTALLPVPMGTLNHFARQLGIETLEHAAAAVGGETTAVDVGDVNGRLFVNNSSIGLYPLLVEGRERRMHRLPKRLADLAALGEELGRSRRLTVCLDDDPVETWMVFVGNNRYCSGLFNITERASVTDGILDIRLVRAEGRLTRLRVLGAALFKRLEHSHLVEAREVAEIVIDPRTERVSVALDGEVEELDAPLRFRSRPGALRVRVPLADAAAADDAA
ncbi:MAG: hypothetical protein NVS1B12_06010 [Acidimicrobiales bacterium]